MEMRILLTGGGGFAGSNLCEYFQKRSYQITATYRNVKPKILVEGVEYIKQELSNPIHIDGDFDVIIHTACAQPNEATPMVDFIRDNIDSARQLVDFATRKRISTIIYFSTRSVYGQINNHDISEQSDIINPDKYGLTKYIAEQIFQEACGINSLGLRLPGIVGPRAHGIWLSDVVEKMISGSDIVVSDYDTVNLVSISDIAQFVEKMILNVSNGGTFKYPVVNLACRESINNTEIIRLIKEKVNSESKVLVVQPVVASSDVRGGLFRLNAERAFDMGFEPSKPIDIVNSFLSSLGY